MYKNVECGVRREASEILHSAFDSSAIGIWHCVIRMPDSPIRIPIEYELDLHAFAARDVAAVVTDYVSAASKAGLREVRLVHGRGRGVQRGIVQSALERHPQVSEFWDDQAAHLGATIARLTIDE
jgi:dsDNA-specific endonuclease/ATPase MutS2